MQKKFVAAKAASAERKVKSIEYLFPVGIEVAMLAKSSALTQL
jgi:hypothetical protein